MKYVFITAALITFFFNNAQSQNGPVYVRFTDASVTVPGGTAIPDAGIFNEDYHFLLEVSSGYYRKDLGSIMQFTTSLVLNQDVFANAVLAEAMDNNVVVEKIEILFIGPNPSGTTQHFKTITLENVTITSLRTYSDADYINPIIRIDLTAEKITHENEINSVETVLEF